MHAEENREEPGDINVRTLRREDLEDIVRIDHQRMGQPRRDYLRIKLEQALRDSSVCVSLAAEIDGRVVGFLMATIFYGDFGRPEPVAILDTIGVQAAFARRGVGRALWRQLALNLKGMRVERVETQVDWSSREMTRFFQGLGFEPSRRISLEKRLDFESDD